VVWLKNLALMACYICRVIVRPVIEFLEEMGFRVAGGERSFLDALYEGVRNGVWMGVHRDPANLVKTIKKLRRKDDISPEVSLWRDIRDRELGVYRCRKGLSSIVHRENQQLALRKKHIEWLNRGQMTTGEEYKWDQLVKGGVIELLDAEEEETVMMHDT